MRTRDAFRGQLREKAARVRYVLAIANRLAGKGRVVLHPRITVLVDERRQLDAQLPAVVEQCRVMARNARWTRVEVEIRVRIERAGLRIADLIDTIAMAQCEVTTAGAMRGLQHDAFVACAIEFVCRGEPRDTRAQNEHAFRTLSGRGELRTGRSFCIRHQPQAERGLICSRRACRSTDEMQQPPT